MSIIYEALKKVQGKNSFKPDEDGRIPDKAAEIKAKKNIKPLRIALAAFLIVIGGVLGIEAVINSFFTLRMTDEEKTRADLISPVIEEKDTVDIKENPEVIFASASDAADEPKFAVDPKTADFILNGIVSSENGNVALINEQIVKKGDSISGALVEEIYDNEVVVLFKGRKIWLKNR